MRWNNTEFFFVTLAEPIGKNKSYQYKFYHSENQSSHAIAVDEHTKNYSEISKYLKCPHAKNILDLEQLHEFPAVKNLYKKFNVIMPSEADVERLFSFGGLISFLYLLLSTKHVYNQQFKLGEN